MLEARTGRLASEQPAGLFTQHTDRYVIDHDDITESEMSFKSRSLLHSVNDRVRKIQDQSSKDATQDSNKLSLIWTMFMSSTSICFHGKGILRKCTLHQKYREQSHNETDVLTYLKSS